MGNWSLEKRQSGVAYEKNFGSNNKGERGKETASYLAIKECGRPEMMWHTSSGGNVIFFVWIFR